MEQFTFGESNRKLLEILGVCPDDLLPVTKITQYGTIILPDECFFTPDGDLRYFTSQYRDMIDRIRDYAVEHRKPTPYKRFIFLTEIILILSSLARNGWSGILAQKGIRCCIRKR